MTYAQEVELQEHTSSLARQPATTGVSSFIQPIHLLRPNIQILQQNYAVAVQDAALTLANIAGIFKRPAAKQCGCGTGQNTDTRKGSLIGVFKKMSSYDKTMPCRTWQ
jgi:hypothetical protein